ncbi:DNA gyrase subunit A [Aneurinibacillus thermoaerophilus]|uniref:DNA gyrase subunit A n=1 Tax=Aneurinibacillus thermoaerophilus TaxID=143495 RepID=A0A1G8DEE9_ANETH|nr:DNA gyrase subunit A [Aneurinibacillus thermoaerophilus]MED0757433.1 DNA gyrase subunit A [Aneurinibacillus thermoaerophilus]MED0759172.1 DNA gyrase subunit A [Aneurinibacillus thermoaerophilus]SDH56052.1 DNA gyrase subunit A [Aneurinibacillus thermoaerophilus]
MAEQQSNVIDININQEMRESFLEYAMSVIVSRALPDVRDGLKPVHRRILYAMNEMGVTPDKPYKKSARIVGDVIGKYHPHGDSAVYETMVRMAQDFSYRYPLVDGHGNFGSIDGDSAAAMRYTEARMSKIATELMRDINKDTIDFGPNYDGNEQEPLVMPARFPHLLVNGTSGIAVGMATNIPPHNLREVIDGILLLIENPDCTSRDLMEHIIGPDFPTGAYIMGRGGIRRAYETGRGSIIIRAKAEIEDQGNKPKIIVTEIPYQVNKARLIEKIAELVREKKLDGITDLRDESDRNGMRIVIELRRDVNPQVVLNNLYKHTAMQTSFGINMLALVNNEPRILNLKQMLYYYLEHQKEVIRRRTEYDLRKAEARLHIVEGLLKAIDIVDDLVDREGPIRSASDREEARGYLMAETFSMKGREVPLGFTLEQANAILDMRLQALTGLSIERLTEEYNELSALIAELRAILGDESKILEIISEELTEIKEKYGDDRRTEITVDMNNIEDEDLIPQEEVVISLTHRGYIKRLPVDTYRAQKRGGRGVQGMSTREDDFAQHLITTNSHNYLLFFTNKGKVYRLKAYEIPELSRTAKGIPIINLLQIEQGEHIQTIIPIKEFTDNHYLFFATKQGIVKRSDLASFSNIRRIGLFAINLREDDELVGVRLTDGDQNIIMGTKKGMSILFSEKDVRMMGRSATGVKGIHLSEEDCVIDMDIAEENADVLIVTSRGYGKRTPLSSYRFQSRGGKGIKTLHLTERNGVVVGLKVVNEKNDLMLVTSTGIIIRLSVKDISSMGRNTQGVKLIRLDEQEEVATVAKVEVTEETAEVQEITSEVVEPS